MTDSAPAPQSCAVIGGGPAGLIAALSLAYFGVPVSLVARRSTQTDNRTTALLASSVAALEALGVWEACQAHAAPLRVMRIADDTTRLWRAPEVRFEAAEIDLLNRSLLSDFLPVQGLRGLGLYALDRIGPLRRVLMREGIAPSAAMPLLMHHGA